MTNEERADGPELLAALDAACPAFDAEWEGGSRYLALRAGIIAAYPVIAREILAAVTAAINAERLTDNTGDPGDVGYGNGIVDALNAVASVAAGVTGSPE